MSYKTRKSVNTARTLSMLYSIMQLIVHYEALIVMASQPAASGFVWGFAAVNRRDNDKPTYAWDDSHRLGPWAPRGDHYVIYV